MKKPNIDFSKKGIKSFLLHHVEKLVLGLGLALLGTFFWLGFSTPKFDKESPKGLVSLSQQAHSHIVNTGSWSEIEEFRQAESDTPEKIQKLEKERLPADKYAYHYLLGTPAKTADTRQDVTPKPVKHLMAHTFTASVLTHSKLGNKTLNDLPLATDSGGERQGGRNNRGGGGRDERGGRGSGGGMPPGMGGGGAFPGAPPADAPKRKQRDDGKIKPGDSLAEFHEQEFPGIRPRGYSRTGGYSYMCNVTVVTGIVEYEDEYNLFKNSFKGAKGYDPFRDRPIYQYLQIEKRQIKNGVEGEWRDITKLVTEIIPAKLLMNGPEVIDPSNFNDILTNPIPSLTQVDYRDLAVWPPANMPLPAGYATSPIKPRNVLAVEKVEEVSLEEDPDNVFSEDSTDDERRPNAGGRGGRGGGRGGRGERGGDEMSGGGRGGRGGGSNAPRAGERSASDMSAFEEASKALTANGQSHKLVRFFDIQTVPSNAKEKAVVKAQYRVRLWLADPNNEISTGIRDFVDASAGRSAGGRGDSIGMGGAGLDGGGGGESAGGSNGDSEVDPEEEEVKNSIHVPLFDPMKSPLVRERIAKRKQEMKSGKFKLPTDMKNLPYDHLEFTIQSDYSEPSNIVTIGGENRADFFAGSVVPPKTAKINNRYVEVGEPAANMVAADWNPGLGVRLPANREVSRSDVLTFEADVHLIHPIDWRVHKVEGAKIKTDAVVIDIMGGREVRELSNSRSPMKYHIPGEVLVMTPDGDLIVRNDIEDKSEYFLTLLQEDEIAEVGGRKSRKKDTMDERGGRGRGGRGGGDDAPDF